MRYVRPMNCEQFTQHLLTLRDGDEINFACELYAVDKNRERYDDYEVDGWYFAKVILIPNYDSRFILIDYCGGQEAFAIPLNNYMNKRDDDDTRIVPVYVKEFFRRCPNLGSINKPVYVEFNEDDE